MCNISLEIRAYLNCISLVWKGDVACVHMFQQWDTVVLVLWLWASGTLSDDSRTVTWRSVTARRWHWQRVADSAARQTYACVTGCVSARGSGARHLCYVVALICVHFICLRMLRCVCCLCIRLASNLRLCVCVGVLMWWCSDVQRRVWRPVVSVVASVTLTASLSTQELLSHAGCFCQCWAEAVTPQRFTALCVRAADSWALVPAFFPAEQTAPCWPLS